MRLSDLIPHLGPTTYTLVSLVIFFSVFVGITIAMMRPSARAEQAHARLLPLEDGDE
jgi:cbb3-type cytochrome oxidase subunit 3